MCLRFIPFSGGNETQFTMQQPLFCNANAFPSPTLILLLPCVHYAYVSSVSAHNLALNERKPADQRSSCKLVTLNLYNYRINPNVNAHFTTLSV